MIMEMERRNRSSIITYVARRRSTQAAPGPHPRDRGAGLPALRPPIRFQPYDSGDSGRLWREDGGGTGAGGAGPRCRPPDDAAAHGEGRVRSSAAKRRTPADLCEERCRRGARFPALQAGGYRRHRGRGGLPLPHAHRRTEHSRGTAGVPIEDPAFHAGEMARPGGCGDALSPALSGPDLEPDRKSTRLNSSHITISYAV